MKFLLLLCCLISINVNAQIPKSGTYTYSYCDEEYNKCIEKCKVVIKGVKIWVYAPPNITLIKEGELFEKGFLAKTDQGKWVILYDGESIKTLKREIPSWLDFKRKRFWTF